MKLRHASFTCPFLGSTWCSNTGSTRAPLSTWASAEVTATCICPSTMAMRRRALRCASRSRMWMRSATNCARETTPMLDHRSRTHLGTRVTSLYRIPSGTGSLSPVPSAPEATGSKLRTNLVELKISHPHLPQHERPNVCCLFLLLNTSCNVILSPIT